MKKFFMVALVFLNIAFVVTPAIVGRSNASITPLEKTRNVFGLPDASIGMLDADYQKIITLTSTLDVEWQRSALKAIPRVIKQYGSYVDEVASEFNLTPHLLAAGIVVESLGNPYAVSRHGARGCMQTMPATEKDLVTKGDPFNCRTNIRQGAEYLAQLRDRYGYKDTSMMLAAYVDGPQGVQAYTRDNLNNHEYIKKILFVMFHIHRMHNTYVH